MNPYKNLPSKAFWKTGVVESNPSDLDGVYAKKWNISASDKIATVDFHRFHRQLSMSDLLLFKLNGALSSLNNYAYEPDYKTLRCNQISLLLAPLLYCKFYLWFFLFSGY